MEQLFIKLLNMSISAGWIVLAAVIVRSVLKRVPKNTRCFLWAIVGIRLVCPFSFESIFSLIPSAQTVPQGITLSPTPELDTGIEPLDTVINPAVTQAFAPEHLENSVNPLQVWMFIAAVVWLLGVAAMAVYAAVSYFALRRKVAASVNLRDNIWVCDDIDSPFILGIIKPKIYLPSALTRDELKSVEAHENAHIARRDHWWKPLGYALLCIHWFNPLIWLAYALLCKDIELACDEKVIADMNIEKKKEYSQNLLNCAVSSRRIAACPLAFGEVGVKERIKSVLSHKKASTWVLCIAIAVCAVFCLCFLTNPVGSNVSAELESFLSESILSQNSGGYKHGDFQCESHTTLGTKRQGNETTVYLLVMYSEFSLENGKIVKESGGHIPTAITVEKTENGYKLVEYWESEDGTRYVPSIRAKFPWYLANTAINIHHYADKHNAECIAQAEEYFGVKYVDPYAGVTFTTTTLNADSYQKMPSLEQTAKMESFDATQLLYGFSKDELVAEWGEPDSCLSGLWGDIWEDDASGLLVIVYYRADSPTDNPIAERILVGEKQVPEQIPVDFTAHYSLTPKLTDTAPDSGVFVINSRDELAAYCEQFRNQYNFDTKTLQYSSSFSDLCDMYGNSYLYSENFFEENSLIIVIETCPNSALHNMIDGVFVDAETLYVGLQLMESETPDAENTPTTRHIIVEIPKTALRNNIAVTGEAVEAQ